MIDTLINIFLIAFAMIVTALLYIGFTKLLNKATKGKFYNIIQNLFTD